MRGTKENPGSVKQVGKGRTSKGTTTVKSMKRGGGTSTRRSSGQSSLTSAKKGGVHK